MRNSGLAVAMTNGAGSPKTPTSDLVLTTSGPDKDTLMDTSGPSTIVTLEPYTSKSLSEVDKSVKKKVNNVAQKMQIAPGVYELVSYNKFLLLEIENNIIENINVFKAHREIVQICGTPPKIRPQGDERLLIEVSSPEQSENLMSMNRFLGHNVKVFPHPTYNQCRGVIYAPQLLSIDPEEIQSELEDQGVTKVLRMRKKVGNELIPLATLILTFNSYKLPNNIKAGWLNFKVKPYFPSPLRCYHCQIYGHVIHKCKKKANNEPAVCHNCGKDEHGVCNETPSCIHCKDSHPASSKSCIQFIFEKEVQVIRTMEKISFREARKKVLERQIGPGVLFSTVLKSRSNPQQQSQNGDKKQQKSATVSVASVPTPGPSGVSAGAQNNNTTNEESTPLKDPSQSKAHEKTPNRVISKTDQSSKPKAESNNSKETKNSSPKNKSQMDSRKRERTPENGKNGHSQHTFGPPKSLRKLKRMDKKKDKT